MWSVDCPDAVSCKDIDTLPAIDTGGNVQPVLGDSLIAGKDTYWESNGRLMRRVSI